MEIGKTTESGPAGPARASAAPREEIKRERCVSTSLQAALEDNSKINNTQATEAMLNGANSDLVTGIRATGSKFVS